MVKAHINSGVCGFQTEVTATADDSYEVTLVITSECKRVQRFATELSSVAMLEEISKPINETQTYLAAGHCRLHSSCAVPCGVLKVAEVASGLALSANVQVTLLSE